MDENKSEFINIDNKSDENNENKLFYRIELKLNQKTRIFINLKDLICFKNIA